MKNYNEDVACKISTANMDSVGKDICQQNGDECEMFIQKRLKVCPLIFTSSAISVCHSGIVSAQ